MGSRCLGCVWDPTAQAKRPAEQYKIAEHRIPSKFLASIRLSRCQSPTHQRNGGMLKIRSSEFRSIALLIAALGIDWATGLTQQPKQYTNEDYAAAERMMNYNVNPLAYQGVVHAQALADGRFWYRDANSEGVRYVLIDPGKGTRATAFDHAALAAALQAASEGSIKRDAAHLSLSH